MIFNRKNYNRYFFNIIKGIMLLFMSLGMIRHVDASNSYRLGSEQELFNMIYHRNNIYKLDERTNTNLLSIDPLIDNNISYRNTMPEPILASLNRDELYAPGEFFAVYKDSPFIQNRYSANSIEEIIQVNEVELYDILGTPAIHMRQGRPYNGYLKLIVNNDQLAGSLHSLFYKLPGQFDSIGSDPALIYNNDHEVLGKIHQTISGDRYLQIDFNEDMMDQNNNLELLLPVVVRARPEVTPGKNSVAFSNQQIKNIDVDPYDPGIFSWVDVEQFSQSPMAKASSKFWEDNYSLGGFAVVDLYPNNIKKDYPKFTGYDTVGVPTYFLGKDSNYYYPDEVGFCIDPFHTVTQNSAPIFEADIDNFIAREGAKKLNLSLHLAAWRAQTAKLDPLVTVTSHSPIRVNSGIKPFDFPNPKTNRGTYMNDYSDSGRKWMVSGQIASWLFSMRYNINNNHRLDKPGFEVTDPNATTYNTKYFRPSKDNVPIDFKPELRVIAKMRDMYEDTSYIRNLHLLDDQDYITAMMVPKPGSADQVSERGLTHLQYSQRDFYHYIDEEESKNLACLDIEQIFEDDYQKINPMGGSYYAYKKGTSTTKTTKFVAGQKFTPFTELRVKAKCNLKKGDAKIVVRKVTRDFWNESVGFTASIAHGRQFLGIMTIPNNYRPKDEINFYTDNGQIILVKYDEEHPPSYTNSGTRLNGAEFTLYSADGKEISKHTTKQVTNPNTHTQEGGIIFVQGLPAGDYYFKETKPADGYQANPDKKYSFTIEKGTFNTIIDGNNNQFISVSGDPVLGVPNKKLPGTDVVINKSDSENGKALEDAMFMLYKEDSGGNTEEFAWGKNITFKTLENKETDRSGKLTFKGLQYNTVYMIKEVQAPNGYQLDDKNKCIFKINFDDTIDYGTNNHCFDTGLTWNVTNDPEPIIPDVKEGFIEFIKYGRINEKDTELLSNVKFGVYNEGDDKLIRVVYSNNQGVVNSGFLPEGSYYFQELESIDGYKKKEDQIKFEIDENGESKFTTQLDFKDGNYIFYNDPKIPDTGSLIVTKYDGDSDLGIKLEGATFKLCRNEEGTRECKIQTTDSTGKAVFTPLDLGTYYLIEVEPPKGYRADGQPKKIEIKADSQRPANEIFVYENVKNFKNRSLEFKKVDKDSGAGLEGAEFQIQRRNNNGQFEDISGQKYSTESDGSIKLDENIINKLGLGTYRLKEVKAPDGYLLPVEEERYSKEFQITDNGVSPDTLRMENKRLDHELEIQKTVDNELVSPANIVFVIQGKNKNTGHWERFLNNSFSTDMDGHVVINNKTDPGVINSMLASYNNPYTSYRFREAIVPYGSILEDPQYPMSGEEPDGDPGNKFSSEIPIEDIKKANDRGENYRSKPIEIENKVTTYRISFTKKDSINGEKLSGAEFKLTEYESYDPKGVNKPLSEVILKPDENGEYHHKGLLIDKDYILEEVKSPLNYGSRSDKYWINLRYDKVPVTKPPISGMDNDFEGIYNQEEVMHVKIVKEDNEIITLKDGKDYMWDNNVKDKHLSFIDKDGDLKNTALPKIPMTGGTGFTIFSIIGLVFSGFGYLLYLYIEKKLKRSE